MTTSTSGADGAERREHYPITTFHRFSDLEPNASPIDRDTANAVVDDICAALTERWAEAVAQGHFTGTFVEYVRFQFEASRKSALATRMTTRQRAEALDGCQVDDVGPAEDR